MQQPPLDVTTGVWTSDNSWVSISSTVSFDITDPERLDRTVGDAPGAVEQAVVLALRNAAGTSPLDQVLNSAEQLGGQLPAVLNARTADFGVVVTGVEVTGIAQSQPPRPDVDFLREPGFSVVLRGYDRTRVDDLLRQTREALLAERTDLREALVRELSQPIPVRLRGYDRVQVDNLVTLLGGALRGKG